MDIGIDLGTTFSVLAVDGKVDLAPDYPGGPGVYLDDCDVTVIPSPCGEQTFPSVMIQDPEDPTHWLFGSEALQKAEEGFAPIMFSKRKIGTLEEIPMATGTVMAKEVAARFLRHMKQCAERALGRPVRRAVVTHPAYFDRGAVEETRWAAQEAGFDMSLPQQMLMEPTAAALSFTRTDPRDPLRILTYDLGGGTFDVTYMERIDGVIQVRSFDGNHLLGGYNFDKELVHMIRTRLAEKGRSIPLDESDPKDRGRLARLLRIAENVKIELSRTKTDADAVEFRVRNVLVDDKGLSVQVNERITRRQFVAAIQPRLEEAIDCCRRALVKGKARAEDVHLILLVGGSSYGPWVTESLRAVFPGADMRLFNPDLCVGAGAAIHARMALPRGEDLGRYSIERETPETSVLDRVQVAGRFLQTSNGQPPPGPMTVTLKPTSGSPPQPVPLARNGRFVFQDVELPVEGTNKFTLSLKDADGKTVAECAFATVYAPPSSPGEANQSQVSRISTPTTVLPRPLYIETARGLIPLAEEGVALPAKCVATFERSNSNPNMVLKLFQEQDPVGAVRVENIPEEAGAGSPVVLTIEVTANNQVCGDVVIYRLVPDQSGKAPRRVEALRTPIDVSFDPTAIPTAEELQSQFGELQMQLLMLPLLDPFLAGEVKKDCMPLIESIQRGFEQQPFERQEVYVAVRRLRNLLVPPKDDMTPSRREFITLTGMCRKGISQLRNKNNAILAELSRNGAKEMEIDGKKVSAPRVESIIKRLAALERQLDELEQAGLAAHAQKDRVAWPKRFERVSGLAGDIEDLKPKTTSEVDISTLPTPLLKMMVLHQEIGRRMDLLARHARAFMEKGEFDDWIGELEGIKDQLDAAGVAVSEIDDGVPSEQALAKIRVVLMSVNGLDARIAALGKNLQ
jgi:actin-like ATPase involved in cell morphogenesis